MQAPAPASTPRTALAPQPQQRPHQLHHHQHNRAYHQQQQQQGVRLYDAPPPRPRTATAGSASSHRSGAPLPYAPTAAAAAALTSSVDTDDVYFSRAQVVDSRISYTEDNRRFVEYKLEIETTSRGTLFAWHRYSVFLQLAATLQLRESGGHGYRHEIPRLPSKKIFGNFSDATISARVEKLNWFLAAATGAEFLDWGIRVDDGTCVYKRSAARSSSGDSSGDLRDSMTSNASTATAGSLASPRRRLSRRLSLKSFGFRRNSNAV